MKRTLEFLPCFLIFLVIGLVTSCSSGVSEKEFLTKFKTLSDNRIQFRKNMKALGDSSFTHKSYARLILEVAEADTVLDPVFGPAYAAYNDSIRQDLKSGKNYFESQFIKNKPMIGQWEKNEMKLDQMVEQIKSGDLSEREGMDSIETVQARLVKLIHQSDSLVKISTDRYWKFRNTNAEYLYNMKNLRILFANELYKRKK